MKTRVFAIAVLILFVSTAVFAAGAKDSGEPVVLGTDVSLIR